MIPQPKPDAPVYAYEDLLAYATQLGMSAGLPEERARIQAEMLLESDLMGHTTHGLNLLPVLLAELGSGGMKANGEPVVLADHPAALHWDGQFLPGTWLMVRAIEAARAKLKNNPVVTVVIRQAHHIAGLVAYLRMATEAGLSILIVNSDPSSKTVAAHGGIERQITPNPLAFGYPTDGAPVLIDISTSTTANGWVRRWMAEGRKLPGKWVIDHAGHPSDDPAAMFGDPPGALLRSAGLTSATRVSPSA
jgi:LDH2 family malate/lactate/ureidoglycolate dehydrogenase